MIQLELQFIEGKAGKKCHKCGAYIVGKAISQIYCSKTCREEVWRKGRKRKTCPMCGQDVVGHATKVYCSRECCNNAGYEAKYGKRIQVMADRSCPVCGKDVVGPTYKVYCSGGCCKVAMRKLRAERYKANSEKCKESVKRWKKANPEKVREYRRKYYDANLEHVREKNKKWNKANPEKVKGIKKKWQQANREKANARYARRRARKRANGVEPTAEYREAMVNPLTRQVCFYCGTDCTGNHHWDHHIPIAAGGPDAPWNLVVSCPTCNMSKGARLPESIFCEKIFKE